MYNNGETHYSAATTVTAHDAVNPPSAVVAVMSAVPTATAFTVPSAATVAIASFDDL